MGRVILALTLVAGILIGCGGPPQNIEKVAQQPPADLEKAKNAQTIADWAAANPNNEAPGHGDSTDK